jgi:hypothetical protein
MAGTTHERYTRGEAVEGSSDRSFGFVFTALFLLLALSPLRKGQPVRVWFLVAGAAVLLIAILVPALLAPFNRLWTRFALLLGKVTTPIMLALIFYGVFAPVGFVLRLFKWDPLRLTKPASSATFWVTRQPPGPEPESMKHLF